MPSGPRDITLERGVRAAACVDRHLADLARLMQAAGVPYRTVEGSAVAAEVFLAETNTLNIAVRVAVVIAPRQRRRLETAVAAAGFVACDPTGDATLLRLASREGRRAIHVLFGLEDDGATGPDRTRLPDDADTADPHGVRRRSTALYGAAWREITATYRRVKHETHEQHDVTESFEVQVLADAAARRG